MLRRRRGRGGVCPATAVTIARRAPSRVVEDQHRRVSYKTRHTPKSASVGGASSAYQGTQTWPTPGHCGVSRSHSAVQQPLACGLHSMAEFGSAHTCRATHEPAPEQSSPNLPAAVGTTHVQSPGSFAGTHTLSKQSLSSGSHPGRQYARMPPCSTKHWVSGGQEFLGALQRLTQTGSCSAFQL